MEQEFSKNLRDWYHKNGRKLPWRQTKDPYKIWISEIILQQTRVDQGLPYYYKFIEAFPTLKDLAEAPLDKVLRLWQGLGYYSRARNMHSAALQLIRDFGGVFPSDYVSLKKLKGIGEYTAAALASFAFDLPHPVVDGNVYRFLSRFSGCDLPIDSSVGKREFAQMAEELLDPTHAATHNQAMMEIGALVCKPVSPVCDECPFSMACHALIYDKVALLPVKEKKQKVRKRYFHYFFFNDGRHTYIRQRNSGDIWEGLYEFPLLETESENIDIQNIDFPMNISRKGLILQGHPLRFRHLLSHQELIAHFWKIGTSGRLTEQPGLKIVDLKDMNQFAFPRLIIRFLEKVS